MSSKFPFYRQNHDYSCGAACLRMAFAHYGMQLREKDVARAAHTSPRRGTPKRDMRNACSKKGFSAHSFNGASLRDAKRLAAGGYPVIINYIEPRDNEDHYALLVSVGRKFVVLNDPWNGKSFRLSRKEFVKRWWGWSSDERTKVRRWLMAVAQRENN